MDITELYKPAVSQLRQALGRLNDQVPVPMLNQILSVTQLKPVVIADASVTPGSRAMTSGSCFVLAEKLALIGHWENGKTADPQAGSYGLVVTKRSALRSITLKSDSGAPWVASNGELCPWSYHATSFDAKYDDADPVTFPMGSADGDATERLLGILADDLSG